MAPKRPNPKEDPPAASFTEEESFSTEEQGEKYSSSEEEDQPPQTKTTSKPSINKPESDSDSDSDSDEGEEEEEQTHQPRAQPKPSAAKSDSDSDSGSDIDSSTESDTKHAQQNNSGYIKHAAKRPRQGTPKKPSYNSLLTVGIPSAKAAKKGSKTDQDTNNLKRAKKAGSESDRLGDKSEDKKQLFQRLFSEEDEVTLLEGLIEFESANGINPSKDMNAFHNFIRRSLNFDASVAQLNNKIDNLKRKLRNNLKRGKLGEDSNFTNPHEKKVFNLSKKLWGGEPTPSRAEVSARVNGKVKNAGEKMKKWLKMEAEKVNGMDIDGVRNSYGTDFDMIAGGVTEEFVLRRGLDLVDGAKRAEMEKKWRKLNVASLELFLQRRELIGEQAKLLLEASKNGNE